MIDTKDYSPSTIHHSLSSQKRRKENMMLNVGMKFSYGCGSTDGQSVEVHSPTVWSSRCKNVLRAVGSGVRQEAGCQIPWGCAGLPHDHVRTADGHRAWWVGLV